MYSATVYDAMVAAVLGSSRDEGLWRRALAAPARLWARALWIEQCGPQLARAQRSMQSFAETPPYLEQLLQRTTLDVKINAMCVRQQVLEVAAVAEEEGIPIVALKGAARVLFGKSEERCCADIDLLVLPQDAGRLHTLMRERLGYAPARAAERHHLAELRRPGDLPLEIHHRLWCPESGLAAATWRDASTVVGWTALLLPSATDHLLHTLEHSTAGAWGWHYRLRDIVDCATAWGHEIDSDRVAEFVRASSDHGALELLLSAAHDRRTVIPAARGDSWRAIRRVAVARLATAAVVMSPAVAHRMARFAGVAAEASPRLAGRLGAAWGLALTRSLRRSWRWHARAAVTALGVAATGCADPTNAKALATPAFLFVSEVDGRNQLFRLRNDTIARLTVTGADEMDPHSAAGRVVFTSWRDGNAEIYVADEELTTQMRITTSAATDNEPALDPTAARVAFVSARSGTPRLWLMDAGGGVAELLETGSDGYIPERAPVWSPDGSRIAFTSTRTGTTQVFVVPAAGGTAEQLTHEAAGALDPAWALGGSSVVYTALGGPVRLRVVEIATASTRDLAVADDAGGLGDAACEGSLCLAVLAPDGTGGDIILLDASRGFVRAVLARPEDDRQPALVR